MNIFLEKLFFKSYFTRRETWVFQSISNLWDTIVQDTRTHVKYHTIMSDVCGKYMYDKFNEISEDTRRMFAKVRNNEKFFFSKPNVFFFFSSIV